MGRILGLFCADLYGDKRGVASCGAVLCSQHGSCMVEMV